MNNRLTCSLTDALRNAWNFQSCEVDYSYDHEEEGEYDDEEDEEGEEKRDYDSEMTDTTLVFDGKKITIHLETRSENGSYNDVLIKTSFGTYSRGFSDDEETFRTPDIEGWRKGDAIELLRIVADKTLQINKRSIIYRIDENIKLSIQRGKLESRPTAFTRKEEDRVEYRNYERILQLIDKNKYDDVEVYYNNTEDTESFTATFYRNGKEVDDFGGYCEKETFIFPDYNVRENYNPVTGDERPFLGPIKNDIIRLMMPIYGGHVIAQNERRANTRSCLQLQRSRD